MEYYGEKPKRFTKKWWQYFWDYYKWHTIAIVFVIVCVVVTVIEVKTQEKYDGSLVTVGRVVLIDELSDKLEENIEEAIDDIDQNGEKSILIERLMFSDDDEDVQYSAAMKMKYELKLQTDESFAFIMDEKLMEQTISNPETDGCFATVTEWLFEDINEDNIYYLNEKPYAIKLADSKILKDMGISGDSFYAVLKYNYDEKDEELNKQFENAKKILNAVVKEN